MYLVLHLAMARGEIFKWLASESVELIGSVVQSGNVRGSTSSAGDITIDTQKLIVRDGGFVSSATFGTGRGGDITINASESNELLTTPVGAILPAGILANTNSDIGIGGDININTGQLIIRDGALINNNSGALIPNPIAEFGFSIVPGGTGGDIVVNASQSIELTGISPNGFTTSGFSTTSFSANFSAGDLSFSTQKLIIRDGARITAATLGSGEGGSITVNATSSVELTGTSANGLFPSRLATTSGRIDVPIEG